MRTHLTHGVPRVHDFFRPATLLSPGRSIALFVCLQVDCMLCTHGDMESDRQTHRHTDRQTHKHTDRQTDRHTARQADSRQADRQPDRQQTHRHTGRQPAYVADLLATRTAHATQVQWAAYRSYNLRQAWQNGFCMVLNIVILPVLFTLHVTAVLDVQAVRSASIPKHVAAACTGAAAGSAGAGSSLVRSGSSLMCNGISSISSISSKKLAKLCCSAVALAAVAAAVTKFSTNCSTVIVVQ